MTDPTIDADASELCFGAIRFATPVTPEAVLTSDRGAVANAIEALFLPRSLGTNAHDAFTAVLSLFAAQSTTSEKVIVL